MERADQIAPALSLFLPFLYVSWTKMTPQLYHSHHLPQSILTSLVIISIVFVRLQPFRTDPFICRKYFEGPFTQDTLPYTNSIYITGTNWGIGFFFIVCAYTVRLPFTLPFQHDYTTASAIHIPDHDTFHKGRIATFNVPLQAIGSQAIAKDRFIQIQPFPFFLALA